ncbi:hypothetical protein SDC9_68331 [bioreactor metagenome]|uniref:Uncharacterized protein n=1 Tax=bioreactor metagenome TaxID=1076179 RepID=A0A644Y1U7_9ZZZZ
MEVKTGTGWLHGKPRATGSISSDSSSGQGSIISGSRADGLQRDSTRAVYYTNAAKAKLLLNGIEAGETKEYYDNTGILFWDIPYKAGKLEVVGMDKDNNPVSGYTLQTSKRPYALTIVQTEKQIDKERGLAQIVVQVVDEDGVPVMLSDDEVTCRITGPAKLLGLEATSSSGLPRGKK